MPGERGLSRSELLVADESPCMQARFDRAAHDLAARGPARSCATPTAAFEDKTYFPFAVHERHLRDARDRKKIARGCPLFADGDAATFGGPRRGRARAVSRRSLVVEVVRPVAVRTALHEPRDDQGCVVNVVACD